MNRPSWLLQIPVSLPGKGILLCSLLAMFSLGYAITNCLLPAQFRLYFWQHQMQQNLQGITHFWPSQSGGVALVWTEQWHAQSEELPPWFLKYQPPAERYAGQLKFYQCLDLDSHNVCQKAGNVLHLKNIRAFSWQLVGERERETDQFLRSPFRLVFKIQLTGMIAPQEISINLPNLAGPRGGDGRLAIQNKYQRFQSRMTQTTLAGGHIFDHELFKKIRQSGMNNLDWTEEVSTDDHLVLCQRVDDQCQIIGEATCDRCRYGYFPVVGPQYCPSTGNYACGPNRCGTANWPACWRGFEASQATLQDLCYDGSTTGYCHAGLQTMCRDQILYCW